MYLEYCDTIKEGDSLRVLRCWRFTLLYVGANVTTCGALCAIMEFCTTNGLTYKAAHLVHIDIHKRLERIIIVSCFGKL